MAEEPPTKKVKETTGWEEHTLNCSEAVMKADEGRHLADLADAPIAVLQGIGPLSEKVLQALGLKTVRDLAKYKFFVIARALATLAETETAGGRGADSVMNVDKAVDKEYESKSFKEICEAPISALEGLTEFADELLKSLGVKSIGDLAELKYCRWAEAIVVLGDKCEQTKTATERKAEKLAKQLS